MSDPAADTIVPEQLRRYLSDVAIRDACMPVATSCLSICWGFGKELIVSPRVAVAGADGGEPRSLRETFTWLRERRLRAAILRGPVGSGKTILLKLLMQKVIREGSKSLGLPAGLVPVFLRLRELEVPEHGLAHFIWLTHDRLGVAPEFARQLCRRGRLLLCFDDLDAFSKPETRARVLAWIEQLRAEMADSYLVVTSALGPEHESTPSFAELRLCPFDAAQIRAFVRRWSTQHEVGPEPDELLAILDSPSCSAHEQVARLARRPLWLGLIDSLHREGKLSGARGRHFLYSECLRTLFTHGRRKRSRHDRSSRDLAALAVYGQLGPWMHERGRRRIAEAELRELIDKAVFELPELDYERESLLPTLCEELGLLVREGDQLEFAHFGFQESFTAEHLHESSRNSAAVAETLAARFDDSWWQEVIVLVLARAEWRFVASFAAALLHQPAFPVWVETPMMQRCLDATDGELVQWMVVQSAFGEPLGEPHQLAFTGLLSRVGHLPTSIEWLLDKHPGSVVREWWAGQREATPPE